jgi:hypothetical protein
MKKFLQWWKVAGQLWGFLLLIGTLSGLLIAFTEEAQTNGWLSLVWLVIFFGGGIWYVWQSRVHGWKLPKNIRDTH